MKLRLATLLLCIVAATAQAAEEDFDPTAAKAAFHELYQHLGHAYPCFELKQINWKQVGDELLPQADKITTEREFGLLCERLIARLQDSHAQLIRGTKDPPSPEFPQFDPGFACLIDDRDKPVIYYVDPRSPAEQAGVKVGMTVTTVNDIAAEKALRKWMDAMRDVSGYSSERYLRYDAAKGFMRVSEKGDVVKLEVEDLDGQPQRFTMPATYPIRYLPRLPVPISGINDSGAVESKELDDDIGYIYVRRIGPYRGGPDLPEALDTAVKGLGKVKGLIIDVRGNSGGGFDAARACRNFDHDDKAEPDRPRYAGPIALLIDERCISAGEGWASWFIAKKRARVFGTTTAGASARKQEYELSNHLYKVIVPVKAYTGSLDRPIERRGLEPDVPVRCTAKDLTARRDTVLETAQKWLLSQK
jgi:C-terminal processing protease CtpA/Prc